MQFELVVEPADADRLPRLGVFTSLKCGRARTRPERAIWHETVARELAQHGLAVAECRGHWTLERLHPGEDPWGPAQKPPLLAQASDSAGLGIAVTAPLQPLAAFDGRDTVWSLLVDGDPVTITLRRGVVRAVASERSVARILLDGPEDAVLSIAKALATATRSGLPRASLAAEALAQATGSPPPPRRLGAPVVPQALLPTLTVLGLFQYALGHLTDVVAHFAPDAAADTAGPEPAHQMRVAVRRARSAMIVCRTALACPAFHHAGTSLKTLGARLRPARDWDVFTLETALAVAEAVSDDRLLTRLRNAAEGRCRHYHAELRHYLTSADFRVLLVELAWLSAAQGWAPEGNGMPVSAFAPSVMQKRARRLHKAADGIEHLGIPALHGLRLRAKRVRYAAELFATVYPSRRTDRFIRRLTRLQQDLGVLNDGAVAGDLLAELGGPTGRHAYAVGLVLGHAAARAEAIRPRIFKAWQKYRQVSRFWA